MCKNPDFFFPEGNRGDEAIWGCTPAKQGTEPKEEDLRSKKNGFFFQDDSSTTELGPKGSVRIREGRGFCISENVLETDNGMDMIKADIKG